MGGIRKGGLGVSEGATPTGSRLHPRSQQQQQTDQAELAGKQGRLGTVQHPNIPH